MNIAKSLAAVASTVLVTTGHAQVFSEGFDSVASLSNWVFTNNSTPAPSGSPAARPWQQGNGGFSSQAGASTSYAAASYLSSGTDTGVIDNWLITPQLTLGGATVLTFYTRTEDIPGYPGDGLKVWFSSGASSDTASFTQLLVTLGNGAYPTDWVKFTVALPTAATGRIGFEYSVADASTANYIGLDTVSVAAAVPEPATLALMGLGLSGLALARRRAA